MAVPFTKFIMRKWAVLTSKIDKLFIMIGINIKGKKKPFRLMNGFIINKLFS